MHPPRCESIGCAVDAVRPGSRRGARRSRRAGRRCADQHVQSLRSLRTASRTRATPTTVTVKHEVWGSGRALGLGSGSCRDWCSATASIATSSARCRIPQRRSTVPSRSSSSATSAPACASRRRETRRQREVAQALERAVDAHDVRLMLTTGDNIYASKRFLLWTSDSGDEDDDWFFTYFQPYRYVLNRVPVCPSIGNHDTRETEEHDDREQVMDNFYLRGAARRRGSGRARVGGSGAVLPLPRLVGHRVRVLRHVEGGLLPPRPAVRISEALGVHAARVSAARADRRPLANPVRTSSAVLCRPQHRNTDRHGAAGQAVRGAAACGRASAGTSTTSSTRSWNGIDYFVSGAGSKIRRRAPRWFEDAHTETWSGECHFLLVTIDGTTMTVRAIGESGDGAVADIPRRRPAGEMVQGPIVVSAAP